MRYSPCMTLPVSVVETLVSMASRGGVDAYEQAVLDDTRQELADTIALHEAEDMVVVPRLQLSDLPY